MQRTKLGISVGLLGAALYFSCYFGGILISVIMAAYVLLYEENTWLRRSAVKGVALMFAFSVLSAVLHLIPNAIDFIDSIFRLFDGDFYLELVSELVNLLSNVLSIAEKILFLLLGLKAFNQGTVKVPVIDALVSKHMY